MPVSFISRRLIIDIFVFSWMKQRADSREDKLESVIADTPRQPSKKALTNGDEGRQRHYRKQTMHSGCDKAEPAVELLIIHCESAVKAGTAFDDW